MTDKKKASTESGYQKCAFEVYWALGDGRSHAAVAEKLGTSTSAIKQWAVKFGWRKRLNHRISWQSEQKVEPMDDARYGQIQRGIKFLDTALAHTITHLAEGNLKASPQDLASLHRLEEKISRTISQRSIQCKGAKGVPIILPDNRRDRTDKPVIPKSQLNEYLDYLEHGT
jgi:hypothetical protein